MRYRRLGKTGLRVSEIAFGAGPIANLMTGNDRPAQFNVVEHAVRRGINWFDTAAGYGAGASETSLGGVLAEFAAGRDIHIATKVRLLEKDLTNPAQRVVESCGESLRRLRVDRVTLLQLHNAVTPHRGEVATSLTAADVLGPGGVLDGMRRCQEMGWVDFLGLTGTGDPPSLRTLIDSGHFDTIQAPYHLLNPSAGECGLTLVDDVDYGNLFAAAQAADMGIFAIRVLAGGALADREPSPHTLTTPFFPLELYQRDRDKARRLRDVLAPWHVGTEEAAIRFALSHPAITAALVGFALTAEIDQALQAAERGPLEAVILRACQIDRDQRG